MSEDTKTGQPGTPKNDGGDATSRTEGSGLPAYRPDLDAIVRGLTPVQRRFVHDGSLHGDVTMTTVSALRAKAMFYHHIDSPNGRCGPMLLTPLGKTVQSELRARAAKAEGRS